VALNKKGKREQEKKKRTPQATQEWREQACQQRKGHLRSSSGRIVGTEGRGKRSCQLLAEPKKKKNSGEKEGVSKIKEKGNTPSAMNSQNVLLLDGEQIDIPPNGVRDVSKRRMTQKKEKRDPHSLLLRVRPLERKENGRGRRGGINGENAARRVKPNCAALQPRLHGKEKGPETERLAKERKLS